MRWLWIAFCAGCAVSGRSSGVLDLERGRVAFDGGALVMDLHGSAVGMPGFLGRQVVVTNKRRNFHCRWAHTQYSSEGGLDFDRGPGRITEAEWLDSDEWRDTIMIVEGTEGVFGGGRSGGAQTLPGGVDFDDPEQTMGILFSSAGEVAFRAVDCGTFR